MKRKIIKIDYDLCDGCGLCLPGCPEGALQIIDGKARLVSDLFCDGLGACVGECPKGALTVEDREAQPYDEERVMEEIVPQGPATIRAHLEHLEDHGEKEYLARALEFLKKRKIEIPEGFQLKETGESGGAEPCGCPSAQIIEFAGGGEDQPAPAGPAPSRLRQWPVQLNLVPPAAPFLEGADLLLAADCVPIAYGGFHEDLLKNRVVVCGCPKFDDAQAYRERLAECFRQHEIKSLTVARMEVPCCSGLTALARQALADSGKDIPFQETVIGVRGEKLQ
jgi:ferredoxin